MINLLGCNKGDFFKLMDLMHYKIKKDLSNDKDTYFTYQPKYIRTKEKKINKKSKKYNPFDKLSELRFR